MCTIYHFNIAKSNTAHINSFATQPHIDSVATRPRTWAGLQDNWMNLIFASMWSSNRQKHSGTVNVTDINIVRWINNQVIKILAPQWRQKNPSRWQWEPTIHDNADTDVTFQSYLFPDPTLLVGTVLLIYPSSYSITSDQIFRRKPNLYVFFRTFVKI